jgi:hypothetical protein
MSLVEQELLTLQEHLSSSLHPLIIGLFYITLEGLINIVR